jgi:hypothetical protein
MCRLREKKGKKTVAGSAVHSGSAADGAALPPLDDAAKAPAGACPPQLSAPATRCEPPPPPAKPPQPQHGTAAEPGLGANTRLYDSASAPVSHGARGPEQFAAKASAEPRGEQTVPASTSEPGGSPHGTAAPAGAADQPSGVKAGVVNRWLQERDKRMRVVLAAAMEMEVAVAAASYAQSYFDPYMSSSGKSRGAKLHALLRSSHEVVQRLEGAGLAPGSDKDESSFPAVSDVLQQLRALNARTKAREPMCSSSTTGCDVAPSGVGGGKDSPKSHNGSEGHPPTEGPEKPSSATAAHRRHASMSSSGELDDERKDAEGERAGGRGESSAAQRSSSGGLDSLATRGDMVLGGGGGFVSPFSLYGDVLGGRASAESPLSLWDSPGDLRSESVPPASSDQMTASQLRAMAQGTSRGEASVVLSTARDRAPLFAADPWGDGDGERSLATAWSDVGRGRKSVEQLLPKEGGLSSAANGVIRELTWENSSLQKRVEVQANALIEMSVEKERWLAEKARVVSREKEAAERAKLLLEEKTQLKESLQAVIEGLLEENTALRSAVPNTASSPAHAPATAQPHVAPPAAQVARPAPTPPLPPLALPTKPPDHTQVEGGKDGSASSRSSSKLHAATTSGSAQRSAATPHGTTQPPPARPPQVVPFMGVAMGHAALVGTGEASALPAAPHSPGADCAGNGWSGDTAIVKGAGTSAGARVTEVGGEDADEKRASEDLRLEWSLLLSPRYVKNIIYIENFIYLDIFLSS